MLLLLSLLCTLAVTTLGVSPTRDISGPTRVPTQYLYTHDKATTTYKNGCTIRSWGGMDPDGMAGYPWCTTVECDPGATFQDAGVNLHGHIRFYLRGGHMNINGRDLDVIGSAYWLNAGAHAQVSISGAVYIVGAAYALVKVDPAIFSSSYRAKESHVYDVRDAIANGVDPTRTPYRWANGTNGANVGHDPHICNGTTNAADITWSKHSLVDPPSIAVLNCAREGTPVPLYGTHSNFTSYVWYHIHPQGAVYLPYSGSICFQTDQLLCIEPGVARWTSPNLYYIEFFKRIQEDNRQADELVSMAGLTGCEHPVTFGVTNFDPDDQAGQPNFDDFPANARPQPNPWGTFDVMTVRNTVVQSTVTMVDPEL